MITANEVRRLYDARIELDSEIKIKLFITQMLNRIESKIMNVAESHLRFTEIYLENNSEYSIANEKLKNRMVVTLIQNLEGYGYTILFLEKVPAIQIKW